MELRAGIQLSERDAKYFCPAAGFTQQRRQISLNLRQQRHRGFSLFVFFEPTTTDFSLFVFFEPAATTDFSRFAFFIDGDKLLLQVFFKSAVTASFFTSVGVQLQEDLVFGTNTRKSHGREVEMVSGLFGALDVTYINVKVPADDRPRYRTRKGEIVTNVLGVCTPNMQFSYVLPGWEGSAADGRVLRYAISRRNGLKIPQGKSQKSLKGVTTAKDIPTSHPVLLSPTELVESSMPMKVKRKTHSTKHLWTKQEDAALVDCLVELSKDLTWKSENGFRTGYLLHLEKLMAAKVPSSNLKLLLISSQDRATGAGAETPADAVEEINLCNEETDTFECEIDEHAEFHNDEAYVREEPKKSEMETQDSVCPSNKKATARKKKRKSNDVLGDLVGEISKYVTVITEAKEEMKGISTYFKKQTENSDRKMRIYDELMELSDFSQQ
ncbi:hypothetical protein ZIOFF_006329 [Zingiber officinale]|uniref:DDE Tnp4 domain-containing protein n=1 Tax=Zingiber officinale TaxID=94328 RepID=A0A8J5M509_ZINOF|nr:hypothetical protein ZIOFF_006329 [Zingiber officinale]